jgi:hypothetical protein
MTDVKTIADFLSKGLIQTPESALDLRSVSKPEAEGDASLFTFTLGGGERFVVLVRHCVAGDPGEA